MFPSLLDQKISKVKKLIKMIKDELSNQKRLDFIEGYEKDLSTEAEVNNLPLSNIISIVNKIDFSQTCDSGKCICHIVRGTIQAHPRENDVLLLLKAIKVFNLTLDMHTIIQVLQEFSMSELCSLLAKLYYNDFGEDEIEVDYDYELRTKQQQRC